MQSLDVAVLVIVCNVLAETVGIRADACRFPINSIQQTVQTVVGELIAADGAFIACLPSHAADAAVVLHYSVSGVIIQILRELASADPRQPAADVVSIGLLVYGTAMQRLRL